MSLRVWPVGAFERATKDWPVYEPDPERDHLMPYEWQIVGATRKKTRVLPRCYVKNDWPGLDLYHFRAHVPDNEAGLSMQCLLARAETPQQAFHFKLMAQSISANEKAIIRWHELQAP